MAVIAALGVGASTAGETTSLQAAKTAADPVAVSMKATQSAAAIAAYWTPERMAAARPLARKLSSSEGKAVIAGNSATGSPGAVGGILPDGQPMPAPAAAFATTSTGIVPADGGYPGPYTGFKWYPRYRTYPVSTISQIFFTLDNDGGGTATDYFCPGAVTSGGGNLDTVWAAGGCVNNGLDGAGVNDGWAYNVLVCPSYVNGVNPAVGCWAGVTDWAAEAWTTNGAFSRELGAFTTAPTGTVISDNIADAVGGLGFAWNQPRDQHWMVFSYAYYPSALFDGGAITTCATEHRYDATTDAYGPAMNSIGCDSYGEGGPWILGFSQYGGYINSTDGVFFTGELGKEIQGPYYDTAACDFWKDVTGWAGSCS